MPLVVIVRDLYPMFTSNLGQTKNALSFRALVMKLINVAPSRA